MNSAHPSDQIWDQLLADALPPTEVAAAEAHLGACAACAQTFAAHKAVVDAIAAPLEGAPPEADVAAVMRRISARPQPAREPFWRSWRLAFVAGPAFAAAAVLVLTVGVLPHLQHRTGDPRFVARGGDAAKTLAQQVGIHFAALEPQAVPLSAGMAVSRKSGLVVSYRNLETKRPVYLLAFAVDAAGNVHWLYPAYETEGTNPASVQLAPHAEETVMPQAVLLESPALGPLRLVSVVSAKPLHVLDVESLPADARTPSALEARWPDAAVSEVPVVLTP